MPIPGFSSSATDGFGIGAMFTGVFDNFITTKDETQQNHNQLLLGQYGIDGQIQLANINAAASKERNKILMWVAIVLMICFALVLIFK